MSALITILSIACLVLIPGYVWGIWLPGRAYAARVGVAAHREGEGVMDIFERLAKEQAERKRRNSARLDSELAAWETAPTAVHEALSTT